MAVDCGKLQHDRLNVSRLGAYGIVRTIQKIVKHPRCDLVDDSPDLKDLLKAYRRCVDPGGKPAGPSKSLDLISHSATVDHLLALGPNFRIDSGFAGFFADLKDELTKINVERVRLLGCFTGSTPRGLQTIAALHTALDPIVVQGFDRYLYAFNFDHKGFLEAHLVTETSAATMDEASELPALPETAARIDHADPGIGFEFDEEQESAGAFWPRGQIRQDIDLASINRVIQASIQLPGRDLPGLLTVPTVQYRIPIRGRVGRFHLLVILFDWRALQLYPPHDDVDPFAHAHTFLVRPDRRQELKKALEGSADLLGAQLH